MKSKAKENFVIRRACINIANGQKSISIPKWFAKGDYFKILRIRRKK